MVQECLESLWSVSREHSPMAWPTSKNIFLYLATKLEPFLRLGSSVPLAAVRSCVLGGTAPDRWWMVPAGIPPRKQSRAERCWHYLMNESGFLQLAPILLSKGFTLCGESNQWCSGCASAPWTFMEHLWNIYGSGVRQGIMADGSSHPLPCPQRGQRLTGVWMSICTSLQSQTFEVLRWWKTQVI